MRCAKKKKSRRSHKDCHFTQVRYRSLADDNGGGMAKLRTQRTLKPAYTPAIRAFVEQTVAENLGGEWSAVMGNAIRSYGENIETAERQELHKDITLEQFRVMREFACHSGIVTGAEAAVLRVQRPGPSEPERARGRHGQRLCDDNEYVSVCAIQTGHLLQTLAMVDLFRSTDIFWAFSI